MAPSSRSTPIRSLVAVGFKPNTSGLGLDKAGVALNERGWITVDNQCRTSVPQYLRYR